MQIRIHQLGFISLVTAVLWMASPAPAALISNFTDLRTELSDRLGVLSNSVDKAELKQAKTCTKGIAIIDKSLTLASDIKASSKLAKLLEKTFPVEFNATLVGGPVFSNSVRTLLQDGYFSIADQLNEILLNLQLSINALPPGKDRDQAQASLDAAANALEAAFNDTTWSEAAKLLSACLKSADKAQKTVDQANTGGGGGSTSLTMVVDGVAWSANQFVGVDYVSATGEFALGGTRTSSPDSILNLIIPTGVTGPGNYALAGNGSYTVGIFPNPATVFNITSGTLTISTLGTLTSSGTFAFSASDGLSNIVVTGGTFLAPVSQ